MSANVSAPNITVTAADAGTLIGRGDSAVFSPFHESRARVTVSASPGRLMKKIQRHDAYSTSRPPMGGPRSAPMPVQAVHRPTARPLSASNVARRSARLLVVNSAPKIPCRTRPEISSVVFGARPHKADATANPATPMTKSGLRP
jgi:hypothetical protein